MRALDFNQTLVRPVDPDMVLTNVRASGAYLLVEYRALHQDEISVLTIFLNDQGREVMRTEDSFDRESETVKPPVFAIIPTSGDKIIGKLFWFLERLIP